MSPFFLWSLSGTLAILPAFLWLLYWYRKGGMSEQGRKFMLRSFFFGAVGIVPLLVVKYMLEYTPNLAFVWDVITTRWLFFSTVLLIFVLAGLEEFLKSFSLISVDTKKPKTNEEVVNIILYFVSAGLGFAFMENVIYFRDMLIVLGMNSVFWRIFLFRSFGTMLGHALFSGIFGMFWIHTAFSEKKNSTPDVLQANWHKFFSKWSSHKTLGSIAKNKLTERKSTRLHLVLEALFLATFVHAIFNFLLSSHDLGLNLILFVPPFLLFLFFIISEQISGKKKECLTPVNARLGMVLRK